MPLDQWQFYIVTAVALAGVWALVRPFLRRGGAGGAGGSGCGGCASGSSSGKRAVPLTIGGRRR